MRMAAKDGSPGNNNMRFVFQDAHDETSCIASQQRTLEEACKGRFDQGAATSGPVKGDMIDDRLRSPSLLNPLNPLRLG